MTSHTTSAAGSWPPETTSTGNPPRRSASKSNAASNGYRSTSVARTEASMAGLSVSGTFACEPTLSRKRTKVSRRVPCVSKAVVTRAMAASTAGFPRARPRAGGSITHSDRTRSGTSPAASRAMTPPYEWPATCVPGSISSAISRAWTSKSMRSRGGLGG